jgi:hypothetical protein
MENIMKHLITLFLLTLTSCATIITGSYTSVQLSSNVPDTTYTIKDHTGRIIDTNKTNDTAVLKTSKGYFQGETYDITFSKEGYQDQYLMLDSHINPWYFGNLLIGGIVGGLIIDPLTGAMWSLPEQKFVFMQKK